MNSDWLYKEIGARIARRRKHLGKIQEELAPPIGISRASLANIEVGRQKLLVHQLLQIAAVLDVAPADLLPSMPVEGREPEAELKMPADLNSRQRQDIQRLVRETPVVPQPLTEKKQRGRSSKR